MQQATEDRLTQAPAKAARHRQPSQTRSAAVARASDRSSAHEDENRDEPMDARVDQEEIEDRFFNRFAESNGASALPDLPDFPGYHVCWVSTMNPRDTVEIRKGVGYDTIPLTECPGWRENAANAGEYAGVVTCREMVAMRIPTRLAFRMMRHLHHDAPLSEEEKLRSQIDYIKDQAGDRGLEIEEGDGTADIVHRGQGPLHFSL